jgi:hypothetical protein
MISVDFVGRFGNHLFQYAVMRSVAEHCSFNYFADKDNWLGKGIVDVDFGINDGVIKTIYYEPDTVFNSNVFLISDFTGLNGYFQCDKYFDADKVRQWFKPVAQPSTKYSFEDYCFIHFRGGDYNVYPWNMYQLPNSYYDEAKRKMLEIEPTLKFVIITDDMVTARQRFPEDLIMSNSVAVDFATLASARYLIISNSSFSWWTGFLNKDNVVIAPGGWFYYNINKSHYEPKGIKTDKFMWI